MTVAGLFGVPALDDQLGPAGPGATVLVRQEAGTEGLAFLRQAANRRLAQPADVVYLALDREPDHARQGLIRDGGDPDRQGRLHVVDGFSARLGMSASAAYSANPSDPDSVAATLEVASAAHADALLVIDSLSTLLDQAPGDTDWEPFIEALRKFGPTVALATDWSDDTQHPVFDAFSDSIRLRAVAGRIQTSQYFEVDRSSRGSLSGRRVPFRVQRPQGVHVHIPKILVTGPFDAGKSAFVHTVSDEAVSAERRGTTIVMDRGQIQMQGLVAEIFGTPGQERFDPLLDTLSAQAFGVVLIVDATQPDTFARAQTMLRKVWRRGLTVVVAANKQDQAGAATPDQVAAQLDLPPGTAVVPCMATDRESTRAVVQTLITTLLGGAK